MHKLILVLADVTVIIVAFVLSLLLRFQRVMHVAEHQWFTLIFFLLLIPCVFYIYDLYNHLFYVQRLRVFYRIIKSWLIISTTYVVIGFLTKFAFLIESRIFIASIFAILLFLLFFVRVLLVKKILEWYFSDPARRIQCKYVGPTHMRKTCTIFLSENVVAGLTIMNHDKLPKSDTDSTEVFLYTEAKDYSELYKDIKHNVSPTCKLHAASQLFHKLKLGWEWCNIGSALVYTIRKKEDQFFRNYIRRLIDIVGSILGLVILAPIFLVIGIAIKLNSKGPAIYRQKRCGKNGGEFILYKFRSMYDSKGNDGAQLIENDYLNKTTPKKEVIDSENITNVGRILRKTSIDEWPQFVNVLRGDMNLVGPRPSLPNEVKHYKNWHRDRLSVKQGLTGLWQIYGRGEMPGDKSIFLDLLYVINRSLSLDVRLLLETIPAVILGKGAY